LHSIWIANADGTNAHQIIDVAMWPALAPDGKQIAYNRLKDRGIYIANVDGTSARKLNLPESCCAQWSPDAKKLVFFQGNLNFQFERFINSINVDGTGVAELAQGFNPVWSLDGTRIVYSSGQGTQSGLYILDIATKTSTAITRDSGSNPRWSPDGKRIVYQANDDSGHRQVFGVNTDGSGRKQLTFGKGNDGQPVFSTDGNFIFWRSDQDGKSWGIFVMRADGTNPRLIIPNAPPDVNLWARESLSTSP
jgi:TolB protein